MVFPKIKSIVLFFLVLSPLLMGGLSDKPIVTKNEIETKIKIEMIDADNLQRILEDMNDRIKKLEDKVSALSEQVRVLESGQ